MKKIYLLIAALAIFQSSAFTQRYLEEIFTDVTVTSDVQYGMNATVLAYPFLGEAIPENLLMDIYEPSGDTEPNRPVVLYFHTGNFLPYPDNQGTGGFKTDSTAVEICSRLARMGYVAISCDYRLGWNPLAETQPERTYTLINAAYRGVQDCRTAIRFLRKSVAEESNPYAVDESRICVWGQGTGGYIAFAAATLDNWLEDIAMLPKFNWQPPGQDTPIPMVIESINGNADGTTVGVNPLDGDTLCYINHPEYSSSFDVMVNMGGAMGDLTWLEDSSVPMISFHVPTDPFAPYAEGTVIVPTTDEAVVDVSGSYSVQEAASAFTNNAVFQLADTWAPGLPYTNQANLNNDGFYGLYPIIRSGINLYDSSPWDWWDTDLVQEPNNSNGFLTNPDMSATKARLFIDTIQWYSAPRIMCALNLPGSPCEVQGPDNDLCDGALDINSIFGGPVNVPVMSTEFTNTGATGTEDLSDVEGCWEDGIADDNTTYTNDASVWFNFQGDGNDYILVVDDCDGTTTFEPNDTQMAIYSGDNCGNMELVYCNDDVDFANGIYWSGVLMETTDNTNYYVVIDGFNYTDFDLPGVYGEGDFCFTALNYVVSVNEIEAVSFVMFPNPAKDVVRVTAKEIMNEICIYNLVGDMVYCNTNINSGSFELNTNLSAGIYMVEVKTTNGKATQKLIIE
ncbi:MAG: T9SS type A sorting domain-containing protein [Flavobacteriales bacterium]